MSGKHQLTASQAGQASDASREARADASVPAVGWRHWPVARHEHGRLEPIRRWQPWSRHLYFRTFAVGICPR